MNSKKRWGETEGTPFLLPTPPPRQITASCSTQRLNMYISKLPVPDGSSLANASEMRRFATIAHRLHFQESFRLKSNQQTRIKVYVFMVKVVLFIKYNKYIFMICSRSIFETCLLTDL